MDSALRVAQDTHISHYSASVLLDLDGVIRSASQRMTKLSGTPQEKLRGSALQKYLPGFPIRPGTPGYNLAFVIFWQKKGVWCQKKHFPCGQFEISMKLVRAGDENLILIGFHMPGVMRDFAGDLRNWLALFEPSRRSVMVTDPDGIITFVNEAFEKQSGYSSQEVIGQRPSILKSGLHPQHFYAELWRTLKNNKAFHGVFSNRHKLGHIYREEKYIHPLLSHEGHIKYFVSVGQSLSASVEAEIIRLERQANMDFLTGLPNRSLFQDRLRQHAARSRRRNLPFAVAYLDLDDFKMINDHWGHDAGDAVLKETAHRIKISIRDEDTVARLGGDEFAIILSDIGDEQEISQILNKVLKNTAQGILYNNHTFRIAMSIGVNLYPKDGETPETLVRNADAAMYCCKHKGGHCIHFFQSGDEEKKSPWVQQEEQA